MTRPALFDLTQKERIELVEEPFEKETATLVTCPECEGSREQEHDCDCELCDILFETCGDCEGDGKVMATSIPLRVSLVIIDVRPSMAKEPASL